MFGTVTVNCVGEARLGATSTVSNEIVLFAAELSKLAPLILIDCPTCAATGFGEMSMFEIDGFGPASGGRMVVVCGVLLPPPGVVTTTFTVFGTPGTFGTTTVSDVFDAGLGTPAGTESNVTVLLA